MYRLNTITRAIPRTFLDNNRIVVRAAKIGHPLTYKGVRLYSDAHESETYEEFTDRYVKFFEGVDDRFELSRGLNNCFAHDKVPSPSVIEASLRAARRVNDFSTAVRIFEGLKQKVENDGQYKQYLEELKPVKEELGILTKEELGL